MTHFTQNKNDIEEFKIHYEKVVTSNNKEETIPVVEIVPGSTNQIDNIPKQDISDRNEEVYQNFINKNNKDEIDLDILLDQDIDSDLTEDT